VPVRVEQCPHARRELRFRPFELPPRRHAAILPLLDAGGRFRVHANL
jgi:hypothetical protein